MISVVIPVFNAHEYLNESIQSVLNISIVSEIILIDDGSNDGSLQLCRKLQSQNSKIKLFFHDNYQNLGPSCSRNLGISKATSDWISFLDADDFYLSNRFDCFLKSLKENFEFDGIYEAIQYFNGSDKLYSISNPNIKPSDLLHFLIRGTFGHFHTNGLIVKKDLLIRAALFNETLKLHQDSELWLKLAFYGRLIPGSLSSPVAMVRVHSGNRIWKGTSNASRLNQWNITWQWAWKNPVGLINKLLIIRKLVKYQIGAIYEK